MISIFKQDASLIFSYYSSEGEDKNWLAEKIKTTGAEVIKKTFRFTVKDVFRWPKVDDSSEDLNYDSLFDIQFFSAPRKGIISDSPEELSLTILISTCIKP